MMYGMYDAEGRVISIYIGGLPDAQADAEGAAGYAEWVGGEQGEWWWNGNAWAQRPALPDLPAMQAGVEAVVAGYPEVAEVAISSAETGEIATSFAIDASGEMRVTFTVAGLWRVEVAPPFPWLAQNVIVEVTG